MNDTTQKSQRILALDILRGITIAGMILVNNPGLPWPDVFTPLEHAEWIGLTPTDFVFPFFMFIMGITTYLSLRKFNFSWSWPCARKIVKRALLIWFIGLAISWLLTFVIGMGSKANEALALWPRICASADTLSHLRILGVLPRLGICYGLTAALAVSMKHSWLPWLAAGIFVAYAFILDAGNGYAHDSSNILAIIDNAVLGHDHCYTYDTPDPEGLLSTLPALAHVLIGFCVGEAVMRLKNLDAQIERLFLIGTVLVVAGFLLSYGCPISKKLWTPTFSLVTCGFASLLLGLFSWMIDKRGWKGRATEFFRVFGVNPLALYVLSDLLLIPLALIHTGDGTTVHKLLCNDFFLTFMAPKVASLGWAIIYVLLNWLVGLWLYKKKIFIKL